jgi:hypothetical protein
VDIPGIDTDGASDANAESSIGTAAELFAVGEMGWSLEVVIAIGSPRGSNQMTLKTRPFLK